jgi:hypothetical protein
MFVFNSSLYGPPFSQNTQQAKKGFGGNNSKLIPISWALPNRFTVGLTITDPIN